MAQRHQSRRTGRCPRPARHRRCARPARCGARSGDEQLLDAGRDRADPAQAAASAPATPARHLPAEHDVDRRPASASLERPSGTRSARASGASARIAAMNGAAGIGWVSSRIFMRRRRGIAVAGPASSPSCDRRVAQRAARSSRFSRALSSRRDSLMKLSCIGDSCSRRLARARCAAAAAGRTGRRRGRSSRPSSARCRR